MARATKLAYTVSVPFSDDARVMVSPFRTYAELARAGDEQPLRTAAQRVALLLLVLGGFVSLTASGRLVAFHVASTMLFWSFVPAVQIAVLAAVLRLVIPARERPPLATAVALFFTGHGPWMLFLLVVAAVCLFAPDVYRAMSWLLARGVLPAAMLGTIVWSVVLTFACFQMGFGLKRKAARRATALFYLGFVVSIVSYYLLMNQIQPQLPWAR